MAARSSPASAPAHDHRSPCPVACSLDLFGDRWTLLVIRDLMLGASRFKDFTASPESIPTNLLTDRLQRLVAAGIAEQIPAKDGTKRRAYALTPKGESLRPIVLAIRDWGLEWIEGTEARLKHPAADRSTLSD
jgi:DNA-binding HxlR family transcriptional regulator